MKFHRIVFKDIESNLQQALTKRDNTRLLELLYKLKKTSADEPPPIIEKEPTGR